MFKKSKKNNMAGFTLVELSIVLVIIGFLIAGIISGTAMIKQSKISGQVAQMQELLTAINNFKGKYNGLPGDIKLASITMAPNVYSPSDVNANTVIGNGDGYVEGRLSPNPMEDLFVWGQLSSTKMLAGNYLLGQQTNPANAYFGYVLGVNTPISRLGDDIGYEFYVTDPYINGVFNNWIMVGKLNTSIDYMDAAALTPSDAFAIDTKMDDGKPGTGILQILRGTDVSNNNSTCVNVVSSDPSTVEYVYADSSISCRLMAKAD